MENMKRCIDWYLPEGPVRVIDLGAMDVNGSYKALLPEGVDYTGVDLEAGNNVDVVLADAYHLPFADASVDVVLSGQMLEHCGQFWRVFTEVARVLKPGGLAFMIAPSSGPVHRYPVDCYRFYPDSYAACADWAGLRLVQSWTDPRGPWKDIVGVFQKGGTLEPVRAPRPATVALATNQATEPHPDPAVERVAQGPATHQVLADLHALLNPALYVEIGVRHGRSLALARGPAIGIDPEPAVETLPPQAVIHACTSDDFFWFHADAAITQPIDLALIDGMHRFEFVYRDFLNLEPRMAKGGVIVIDDVLPLHPLQATRDRQSRVWTGDVWRFAALLRTKRPDLRLTWLDTAPTGLLVVSGFGSGNTALMDSYNPVVRALETAAPEVPAEFLERRLAVAPDADTLRKACGL